MTSSAVTVTKMNGDSQKFDIDKVEKRLLRLVNGYDLDIKAVVNTVSLSVADGMSSNEIDMLLSETMANMVTTDPAYGSLAAKVMISNLQKRTSGSIKQIADALMNNTHPVTGELLPLLSDDYYSFVKENHEAIQGMIDYSRDYRFDYFGFSTIHRKYLLRLKNDVIERPQDMWMRVAIQVSLNSGSLEKIQNTYNLLSQGWYTHATPTLLNSGTTKPQMSSCFLLSMQEDSIEGIYETLKQCALISQSGGGIGLAMQDVRARGSYIAGCNDYADGIIPMLRVFNNTARYVSQGMKRKGSIAMYNEPWHSDIYDFLDLRKNHGNEEMRARDLFYALWVPDLFMRRVQNDEMWSLMCPNECPGLSDSYGAEFDELYEGYESNGRFRRQVKARDLWNKIITAQVEAGTPYILYKDACNEKSNQKNLGTIKSSNLCVVGSTKILTKDGYKKMSDLWYEHGNLEIGDDVDGEFMEIFTRFGIGKSTQVVRTAKDTETVVVRLGKTTQLTCTPDHKLVCINNDGSTKEVAASDLDPGDLVGYLEYEPGKIPLHSAEAVTSVGVGKKQDVFCVTSATNNEVIFNGMYSKNCAEIIEYSSKDEIAVCNLASLALPMFVRKDGTFDFDKLVEVSGVATKNLNNVIDLNYYPLPETRNSNMRHRPIAVGVQGFATTLMKMGLPFDSQEARELNKKIFEAIYFGAVNASIDAAIEDGVYPSYEGSPASNGQLQFDMWGLAEDQLFFDWTDTRKRLVEHGMRNSLLTAEMPTASTSQIMGNTETTEAVTSNIYVRRTLSGEFVVINKFLVDDLKKIGMWDEGTKQVILAYNGSIQSIPGIPDDIKLLYRTVWEIPQKAVIDMAADRGAFVDQTQSMNLYMKTPTHKALTSAHFYGWKKGLKTGMYYLRSQGAADAIKFTVDEAIRKQAMGNSSASGVPAQACRIDDPDCEACGA